ncbi:MAG: hypothetical protein H7641_07865 [Candidatus Heimdallarchaeota archaeon]|nr:hypothetical protein [Candidatus Heimdallarchaeota archaeon]MCK4877479.1 hypothetical protein [Candidatus Heimdallarchaeota archaeon]
MRLSSSLSLLACILGFLSLLLPVAISGTDYVLTWIDLHESPPLWFYVVATFWVAAQDIGFLDGLAFIRKTDYRIFRALLIAVAIAMSYSLELSVNVNISADTYWYQSLLFQVPSNAFIEDRIRIGYHVIRLCRLILIFGFLEALLERNPRKTRLKIQDDVQESVKNAE